MYPDPLARTPIDPMVCVIHLAAWRARAESNSLNADEVRATFPVDIAAKIRVSEALMCDDMPPYSELVAGLDQLIS
jgi:hypothetical protein